jgi:hypothetical protein
VVTDLGEMYRQADAGAIISLFCRLGKLKKDTILVVSFVIVELDLEMRS